MRDRKTYREETDQNNILRLRDVLAEVDHCLVTALADDPDPVVSEVQVLHVEPDTLGDTDPGT